DPGGGQGRDDGRGRPPDGAVLAADPPVERAGAARPQRPVRLLAGRAPDRAPARRTPVRRGDRAARRPRLRAGGRLVAPPPAPRLTGLTRRRAPRRRRRRGPRGTGRGRRARGPSTASRRAATRRPAGPW